MEIGVQDGRHPGVKHRIGRLDDIADGAAKEYRVEHDGAVHSFFVVRRDCNLFAYANTCPHYRTPLNIWPDRLLSRPGTEIMCYTHGALFEIETGRCVRGPCFGDYLTPVSVVLEDDALIFEDR
jgi:nitrite reductase/ring-hydroxylating ferredoxin subunit